MKKVAGLYLLFLIVIIACNTSSHTSNSSKTNYKRTSGSIHPEFVLFHLNDSITELHFKISNKEILYTRPDAINFQSNVLISYTLISTYVSKEIIDSASVRLVDVNNENTEKLLIGKLNIKAKTPRSYYLRVTVNDLNKNVSVVNTLTIEKDNEFNRQNFLAKDQNDIPLFRSHFGLNEKVNIQYKSSLFSKVYVRYYNREFPLAAPPFSTTEGKPFQYKADSIFSLPINSQGMIHFSSDKKGFYHFQVDTNSRNGFTLFNFSETFPSIKKAEDMIPPLRFITSRQEYDELVASTNKKAAVEKFWLDCTGNTDRAREIIKKFYNRVQDANEYFSSYLEGWKTDRGMIFLIYGAPNIMYRTANSETWIYGEENNLNSLQYTFSKVNNPFSDNDYALERSEIYRQSWYMAVDVWRQGRAYLQD
jgi:GWxTD domain-containing protein